MHRLGSGCFVRPKFWPFVSCTTGPGITPELAQVSGAISSVVSRTVDVLPNDLCRGCGSLTFELALGGADN